MSTPPAKQFVRWNRPQPTLDDARYVSSRKGHA